MHSTADLVFLLALITLALVTPLQGWYEFRRFKEQIRAGVPNARARVFLSSIRIQWIVTFAFLAVWYLLGNDPARVGLVPGWSGWQWLAVGAGGAICVLLILQTVHLKKNPKQLAALRPKLGDVAFIAPGNAHEKRLFDGLSITAGVCEETIYRGLMLGLLTEQIGLWPAALVSTLFFGLAHAYQGFAGIARTALAGAVAVLLTIFRGSIFVAVIVHAIVDMTQGRLISAAVDAPQEEGEPQAA